MKYIEAHWSELGKSLEAVNPLLAASAYMHAGGPELLYSRLGELLDEANRIENNGHDLRVLKPVDDLIAVIAKVLDAHESSIRSC